ncbi:DUF362 domain-containing protein [Candidatus Margulisiibacteriota bacterium]
MLKQKSRVVILKCEDYELKKVHKSINIAISLLGGISRFVKKGETILLKPNILTGDPPERCTTTHPAILEAVAEIFLEAGANVSWGDSPGFGSLSWAGKKAGLAAVGKKLNLKQADFSAGKEIHYSKGIQNKKFVIANSVLEADGIVSLPKLKTHGFQKFTGCIKNQFGCIPGLLKAEFHVKVPDAANFAQMLVDLNQCINPRLYIMDGIWAMEGNGPRGGNKKEMGLILVSTDPVALDATVCRILKLDPKIVPTTKLGHKAHAGSYLENEIELLGDPVETFQKSDFIIDHSPIKPYKNTSKLFSLLNNLLIPKPVIDHKKCTNCGICISICPVKPKALAWTTPKNKENKPPKYDYSKCIRCYCCQEMCPSQAIFLKKPFLRSFFHK